MSRIYKRSTSKCKSTWSIFVRNISSKDEYFLCLFVLNSFRQETYQLFSKYTLSLLNNQWSLFFRLRLRQHLHCRPDEEIINDPCQVSLQQCQIR